MTCCILHLDVILTTCCLLWCSRTYQSCFNLISESEVFWLKSIIAVAWLMSACVSVFYHVMVEHFHLYLCYMYIQWFGLRNFSTLKQFFPSQKPLSAVNVFIKKLILIILTDLFFTWIVKCFLEEILIIMKCYMIYLEACSFYNYTDCWKVPYGQHSYFSDFLPHWWFLKIYTLYMYIIFSVF